MGKRAKAQKADDATDEDQPDLTPYVVSRLGPAYGHGIAILALLAIAALGPVVHRGVFCALLAGSMFGCLPLVVDAALVPRFRHGKTPARSLEVPVTMFFVAAPLAVMCAVGISMNDPGDPIQQVAIGACGIVAAAVAMVAALWCLLATRERRRLASSIIKAPAIALPAADDAWGAIEGSLAGPVHHAGSQSVLVASGANITAWGDGDDRHFSEEPLEVLPERVQLVVANDTKLAVELASATWMTLIRLEQGQGSSSVGDRYVRADIIGPEHPVRVVGRVKRGAFVAADNEPVLVVAARKHPARSLRKLRGRDQISLALVVAALACIPAATIALVA